MGISYNTSTVRDGLVLHLDAANTKSYPGTGTTWNDLSGNGNNGALVNGVAYNAANNGSMIFDGTNDRVSLLSSISGTPPLSFFAWVYRDNSLTTDVIVGGAGKYAGLLFTTDGRLTFLTQTGGTFQIQSNASLISNSTWYYVGVTRGATDKLYLNSIEITSGTITQNRGIGIDLIGATNTTFDDPFKGKISNFKVYNRALSTTEVQQNFEALRGRYGI